MKKYITIGLCIGTIVLIAILWNLNVFFPNKPSDKNDIIINSRNEIKQKLKFEPLPLPLTQSALFNTPNKDNCSEFLISPKDFSSWKSDTRSRLSKLLLSQEKQYVESNVLDYSARYIGLGLARGRNIRLNMKKIHITPRFEDGAFLLASAQQQLIIDELLSSSDINNIANLIAKENIPHGTYFPSASSIVSIVSYIIRSNKNYEYIVEELINSGVDITYTDLIVATREGASVSFIRKLYNSSDLTANYIFKKYTPYTSLATVALKAKKANIALFWHEMGSTFQPDNFAENGFDLLSVHHPHFDHKQIKGLVQKMLEAEITPYRRNTLSKFQPIISPELFSTLKIYFSKPKTLISNEQEKQATIIINQLYKILLEARVTFNLNNNPPHPCFTVLGKKLMKDILPNHNKKRANNERATSIEPEYFENSLTKEQTEKRISAAKALFNTTKEIEEFLAINKDLNSKLTIESYRKGEVNKLSMELSQTINDELEQDNKMQEQQKIIQKLFQLVQQRKFEEALQLVDSLDTNDSLSILFNISLGLGANVEFLLALIDKGAELPSNTINILIMKDDLKTIKVLINYELSLNYLDPLGHSSIQNSVIHKRLSILKYLLESGLTPNELTLGLDALDVAIQNFVLSNDSIEYISLLLRYGSTVKNSHRQLLNEMSVKKPMEYKFLLNKHPNLFI